MSEIKMLPLPEADNDVAVDGEGNETFFEFFNAEQMREYARAVAEHNVRCLTHELANAECAIDAEQAGRKKAEAEIEALRAEREVIGAEAVKYAGKSGRLEAQVERLQAELDNRWAQGVHTCHDKCQRTACVLRRQRDFALKRADRLEEALRECIALGHPRDPSIIAARAALRDHDKEGKE